MENDELNYQFILMRHIDRLSQVCTGYMVGNSGNMNNYANAQPISDDALMYGVKFLDAITPRSLRDDEYNESKNKLTDQFSKEHSKAISNNNEDTASTLRSLRRSYDFNCLKTSINLLDRKGLLLPNKLQSNVNHKAKKKGDADIQEVWEDANS